MVRARCRGLLSPPPPWPGLGWASFLGTVAAGSPMEFHGSSSSSSSSSVSAKLDDRERARYRTKELQYFSSEPLH